MSIEKRASRRAGLSAAARGRSREPLATQPPSSADEPFDGVDPIAVIEITDISAQHAHRGLITATRARDAGIGDRAYIISEIECRGRHAGRDRRNADVRKSYRRALPHVT